MDSVSIIFGLLIGGVITIAFWGAFIYGIIKVIKYTQQKEKERKDNYQNGSYYAITHIPYESRHNNKGTYGEYLVYDQLRHKESQGTKFLFNVYIPIENGQTSEIDAIMLDKHGIFVFESKNYSGWIFGDENSKQWCQCLKSGKRNSRKEYFYNPIKQNEGHINVLKFYLGYPHIPIHNIVVFSDRCSFKTKMNSNHVMHRHQLNGKIQAISNSVAPCLTLEQIETIYQRLYPLTQMTTQIKTKHIEQIQSCKS